MKKLFLTMGAMASVITPVVAVVSCGDDDKTNSAGATTTVDATKASAVITAFVGAADATTGSTDGDDVTDLVVSDFETKVAVNKAYAFSVAGHPMTGFGVILTLKVDKTAGIKWLGGTETNDNLVVGGTITLIATPDEDDATEVDKVYVEFKNGSEASANLVENIPSNNQNFKNTIEAAIKAAGFGA